MKNDRLALDTNILIYSVGGDVALTRTLQGKDLYVSAMVRMESMVYHGEKPKHLQQVIGFLSECIIVDIHEAIQDLAVSIRVRHGFKLPDAVIAATAMHLGIPLMTADTRFDRLKDELDLIRYNKP